MADELKDNVESQSKRLIAETQAASQSPDTLGVLLK